MSQSVVKLKPEAQHFQTLPEPDPQNRQFLNFKARVKQEVEEENYESLSNNSSNPADLDEK